MLQPASIDPLFQYPAETPSGRIFVAQSQCWWLVVNIPAVAEPSWHRNQRKKRSKHRAKVLVHRHFPGAVPLDQVEAAYSVLQQHHSYNTSCGFLSNTATAATMPGRAWQCSCGVSNDIHARVCKVCTQPWDAPSTPKPSQHAHKWQQGSQQYNWQQHQKPPWHAGTRRSPSRHSRTARAERTLPEQEAGADTHSDTHSTSYANFCCINCC